MPNITVGKKSIFLERGDAQLRHRLWFLGIAIRQDGNSEGLTFASK